MHHPFVLQEIRYHEVHGDIRERSLETHPRRHVQIEEELLQTLLHLRIVEVVVTYIRRKESIEVRESLRSGSFALHGIEEIHDLSEGGTQMAGGCALRLTFHPLEAYQKQVAQVPAHAVNTQKAEVVNVQRTGTMGLGYLFRIEFAEPVLRSDARRYVLVEPLERIGGVGALLHPPVVQSEIIVDDVEVREQLLALSDFLVLLAVEHIGLEQVEIAAAVDGFLHRILHPFHMRDTLPSGSELRDDLTGQPACRGTVGTACGPHGLENGLFDFFRPEFCNVAVALYDFRKLSLSIHLLRC